MARQTDMGQLRRELLEACAWGDEAQLHALGVLLRGQPRRARALLEAMLEESDMRVRRAASLGLGELGGSASVKRLERQLALEGARGDHDGSSVAEAITLALGRISGPSARASLLRSLDRLVARAPDDADVNGVALELWRKRHPDLIPAVQRSLAKLALPVPNAMHGLLVLLERTPEELRNWARDRSVRVEDKTGVLALLEAELPEAWVAAVPAFLSVAQMFPDVGANSRPSHLYYCERLCTLLLKHRVRLLALNPEDLRSTSRDMARKLLMATAPNSSLRAALWLRFVGEVKDAALLEAHRPAEPILAESFDESVSVLRALTPE